MVINVDIFLNRFIERSIDRYVMIDQPALPILQIFISNTVE
jgi:hypothetical protein